MRNFIAHVELNEDNKYAHAIALDFFVKPTYLIRDLVDLKIQERFSREFTDLNFLDAKSLKNNLVGMLKDGDKTLIDVYKFVSQTDLPLHLH